MKAPIILKVVSEAALCFGLLSAVATASAQAAGGQSATQPTPPHPARVKLDGFDLSKASAQSGGAKHTGTNQIGGVSRGIGAVKLFAPDKGLAYSLHPTLQWSGSPDTKYKLKIENPADQTNFEVTVDGTSFTYPETAPTLRPGATYSWSVQPDIDIMGGASDSAEIVIAGGADRDAIGTALAAITQTGDVADRARAKVYFDKRAWYDAAEAYSILIAAHPADKELRQIRGTLYDQVPATERLADADFAAASAK
jgi:Domain of Unknown Function (DUF928)